VSGLRRYFSALGLAVATITGMDLTDANWHRSSGSRADKGCVEVAVNIAGIIAVRDGADPAGPALTFTEDEWTVFTTAVRSGHYDETL
jgi:F420-0:gamma-glutamyl ligase